MGNIKHQGPGRIPFLSPARLHHDMIIHEWQLNKTDIVNQKLTNLSTKWAAEVFTRKHPQLKEKIKSVWVFSRKH
jgi:hypothetical protein